MKDAGETVWPVQCGKLFQNFIFRTCVLCNWQSAVMDSALFWGPPSINNKWSFNYRVAIAWYIAWYMVHW